MVDHFRFIFEYMYRILLGLLVFFPLTTFSQWFEIKTIGDRKIVVKSDSIDELYYSTNGIAPGFGGRKIKDSLVVSDNTGFLFRAVKDGKLSDSIGIRTLIFDRHNAPVLSIMVDEDDFWNDSTGIYCKGPNPVWNDSLKQWENCNYQQDWEKRVYMEFIDINGNCISQRCGLKIFGESTRRQPDKSMKLIARGKYGQNRFHYQFFPNDTLKEYKQLVIRTSGNDFRGTRFKDVLNTYLARNLGLDAMNYRPVQLYVNGVYWGLYNLREKINDHYFAAHYNIDNDSVNIVMGRWIPQHGSSRNYKKMYNWFMDLDTMNDEAYEKAKELIDIRNYINYRVFEIYINNADSRGNIRYWQSPQLDNKFRMVLYDTDLSYGTARRKLLTNFIAKEQTEWYNPEWSTMYLRKLLQNKQFKDEFVVQFAHLMNTALQRDTMLVAIDKFEKMYENELPRPGDVTKRHLKKVPIPLEEWRESVNDLRSFAKLRPKYMYAELQEVFGFKGYSFVRISGENGVVQINDNYPQKLPYSGKYPIGYPLNIKLISDSNYVISKIDSIEIKNLNKYIYSIDLEFDSLFINPVINKVIEEKKQGDNFNEIMPGKNEKSSFVIDWNFIAYSLIALGIVSIFISLLIRRKERAA